VKATQVKGDVSESHALSNDYWRGSSAGSNREEQLERRDTLDFPDIFEKGLRDSSGVASEYHGVVYELETFEQALGAVEGLQTEVDTLRLGSENVMRSCREALPGFLGKMQKYDSPFGSGGSSKKWRNAPPKVKWT